MSSRGGRGCGLQCPSILPGAEGGGGQRAAPGSASSHLLSAPKCQSGYDDAPVFPVSPGCPGQELLYQVN